MDLATSVPVPVRRAINRVRAGTRRARFLAKLRILRHYGGSLRSPEGRRYVLTDPELDNFTYELENEDELVAVVAGALDVAADEVAGYVDEAQGDPQLRALPRRSLSQKRMPHYARRLGWYATVRILKPDVIVETGVHSGLGSVLLLRALERNGHGELLSFDTNPHAGWLVPAEMRGRWTLVVGPTTDTLAGAIADRRVEMVIHDSDHTYECERFEYEVALERAGERIVLVSDNAHVTSALDDVSRERGAKAAIFHERPRDHFYPGAALGLALVRPD